MSEREKVKLHERTSHLSGMNWRAFNRYWKQLGGDIHSVRKTGERRYSHPFMAHPIVVGRRKAIPRALTKWLGRIVAHLD